MKKRMWILVLALCVLLLLPSTASANAPAPDPYRMTLQFKNVPDDTVVTVCIWSRNNEVRTEEPYTVVGNRSFVFYTTEGDTEFFVTYTTDGCSINTNTVPLTPQGTYEFNYTAGTLKDRTGRANFQSGLPYLALILVFVGVGVIGALAATMLIEFLTGLCFGMKPYRYVILANLITNPAMNVLLLLSTVFFGFGSAGYWIALAVLELLVVGIEILFYRKKYRGSRSMKRIVLFTVVANVLSCAAGVALNLLIY